MIKRNVWKDVESPLELHEDIRGRIADIFYKDNIHHVAIIDSKAGNDRGNHYHKQATQHILITRGALEYWYKPLDSDAPAKCEIIRAGDMISTPPYEVHALRIIEDNEFVVFSQGLRGGRDYEIDTFRVEKSIMPELETATP
jgi:hypothetical protein